MNSKCKKGGINMFNFLKRWSKKAPKYKPEEMQELLYKYGTVLNDLAAKRATVANINRLPADKSIMKETLLLAANENQLNPQRVVFFLSGYMKLARFQPGVSNEVSPLFDTTPIAMQKKSDLLSSVDAMEAQVKIMNTESLQLITELKQSGLLTEQMVFDHMGLNIQYIPQQKV
jgi:hypothetical protein